MNTQSNRQTLTILWRLAPALAIVLSLLFSPTIALAATCIWNGSESTDWNNAANWTGCGGALPGPTDDVVIPDIGVTHEPMLNTDAEINHLSIAAGRALSTDAYQTLKINGNLQNDGTINVSGSTIASVEFNGSGIQTISGSGTLKGIGEMIINTERNVTLSSPVTLAIADVKNYGTLALGNHTLTISNTTFQNGDFFYGPGTVSGTGVFQTQGSAGVINDSNSSFATTLHVIDETTTASGVLDGAIFVDSAATLQANAASELNARNDVTIAGTLSGADNYSSFRFGGETFTNNGNVDVAKFVSVGASSILTGTSNIMNSTDLVIEAGTLTLGSDIALSSIEISEDASFDISGRTLTLMGSGFFSPLHVFPGGAIVTTGSTIIYGGNVEQQIMGIDYYNLGSSGSGARTLDYNIVRIAGVFSPGSNTYTIANSTIEYNGDVPQALPPSFPTYASLVINNNAGVTLSSDITVNDSLTLNADLFTEGHTLIFGNTYTGVEGDYEVVGAVRRTEFETHYEGAFNHQHTLLAFYGGTLPGEASISMERIAPEGPGLLPSVTRVYTITQSGGSNFSTDIRLHYLESELGGIQEGNLQLWRWNGMKWIPQGRSNINTSQNWVELDDVKQLAGTWAIGLHFSVFLPSLQR